MAKKKKTVKVKKSKPFMLVIKHTSYQYRYIMADSKEHAKEMWENDTWESVEYDFDESCPNDELDHVEKVRT